MQHHSYEEWRGINTMKENLFIWKFFLAGNEFPQWKAHRIRPVEAPGWPPAIQSLWRQEEGGEDTLMRVDTYECFSRTAAHEFLVRLLGEFQSPDVVRQKENLAGDVAFAGPGGGMLLFSRANLVVLMRNAGRDIVEVAETAARFDKDLYSPQKAEKAKVVPEIRSFRTPSKVFKINDSIPLELDASDPLERPLWYKFYSGQGEVFLEEGRLLYRSDIAGSNKIEVSAINANRGVASVELTFDVK